MRVQKPAGVNFANGAVGFAKVSLGPDAGLATLNFTCPKVLPRTALASTWSTSRGRSYCGWCDRP
jgi:hypothetical protein